MPETPWPSGYEFQLSEHNNGGGDVSTWNRVNGAKVGKFYDLDEGGGASASFLRIYGGGSGLRGEQPTAFRNTAGETIDSGLNGFQVLGVMKSSSSDYMPVVFNNQTNSWTRLDADEYNKIHNDSVWGVIATTYPYGTIDTNPMIKYTLYSDWSFKNTASVNFEDLKKAAEGNRTHKYKYLTKTGSIYDKPLNRNMCPGDPQWGFWARRYGVPSEIRCRYDITNRAQMDALAASIQNPGQGSDDPTSGYAQINSILRKFCLRGDNYSINDLGGTGNKLSCKDIVGDVGLLTNFCKSTSSDGQYNVIKNSDLCSYENLETNNDGNYRNVWKEVCEKPSMYNGDDSDKCRLFWATESTLASKPEDNPGIPDPCSKPKDSQPPVCDATQRVVDKIDEAFASGNVNFAGGISSGANRRLCYSGSGRTGTADKYQWEKVLGDSELCNTKIQICNTELKVSGAIDSDFEQKVLCKQDTGDDDDDDDGDPEIINNKETEDGGSDDKGANKSDDKDDKDDKDDDDDKTFLQKYWWILLIVVVIVMMMLLGIVAVV